MDHAISSSAAASAASIDVAAPAAAVPRKRFTLGRRGILWGAIGLMSAFWCGVYWTFIP